MRSRSRVAWQPESERLCFQPVADDHFSELHSFVTDSHVREFLLDGETMSEEWTRSAIQESKDLFLERSVGIWLLSLKESQRLIGFCGFRRFARYGDEPELLYAFSKEHVGKGYATECARAMIRYVDKHTKMKRIESAVDAPNIASRRVLEKVGFKQTGEIPGAFGPIFKYEMFL